MVFPSPGVHAWGNNDGIIELSGPFYGSPASPPSRTPVNGRDIIFDMGKSDGYQRLISRLYNIPPANNFLQAGIARNLDFVGREKQLRELYEGLTKDLRLKGS